MWRRAGSRSPPDASIQAAQQRAPRPEPAAPGAVRSRSAPRLSPSTIQAQPNPIAIRSPSAGSCAASQVSAASMFARSARTNARCSACAGPRTPVRDPPGRRGEPGRVRAAATSSAPDSRSRSRRERADAVQQPVADRLVDDSESAAREPVDDRRWTSDGRHLERVEHVLDGGQRRTAGEGGQRPQPPLVVREQQVVAPPDRRPQRAAGPGCGSAGSLSRVNRSSSRRAISGHGQRPRPRGGQLDRQRQPVQRPAELVDRLGASPGRRGRPGEQLDGVVERRAARGRTRSRRRAPSGTWLVHRIRRPGAASRSRRRAPRPRRRRARSCRGSAPRGRAGGARAGAASPPGTSRAAITVSRTVGPVSRRSSRTSQTAPASARPTAIASAVLPTPPGPTISTSRCCEETRTRAAISSSRPTSDAVSAGRLPGAGCSDWSRIWRSSSFSRGPGSRPSSSSSTRRTRW